MSLGRAGDNAGEGGFPRSRRSPEDDRGQPILFDGAPEQRAFPDELVVTGKLVEGTRSHSGGQWRP